MVVVQFRDVIRGANHWVGKGREVGEVMVGLEKLGNFQRGFPKVSGGERCRDGGANEDVVGSFGFLVAVKADLGGGFVDSILVGMEFGAVGGSKLCKMDLGWRVRRDSDVWTEGKRAFRTVLGDQCWQWSLDSPSSPSPPVSASA